MAKLFVVATPIGNLKDITLRALETLKEVDLILAEDTRVIKGLLEHFDIKKPVLSYHQHSDINKVNEILDYLKQGKDLALVSDSGTPGISDPGAKLVAEVLKNGFQVVPIPGASALVAAASIVGFSMDKFLFLGFPPIKNKRKKFFEKVNNSEYPVIIYESPYRILKTLENLSDKEVVVCRELTKKFETIYRGSIISIIEELKKDEIRGEFVIIIKPVKKHEFFKKTC